MAIRSNPPTSYRWSNEDRELIDALRQHYAAPSGKPAVEIEVLRGALCALAEREGVSVHPLKKSKKKSATGIDK